MRIDYIDAPKSYFEQLEVQKHEWFYEHVNKKLKKDSFVLDFGLGGGYGVRKITKTENVYATDFNNDNKRNIPKNTKWIKYWKIWGGKVKFDAIIICHVIEHLEKPRREIYYLKRLLKKNGRLFIATPNAQFRGTETRTFNHHHVKEYTAAMLVDLVKDYEDVFGITTDEKALKKLREDNARKKLLAMVDFLKLRRFLPKKRSNHQFEEEFTFKKSRHFADCADVCIEVKIEKVPE